MTWTHHHTIRRLRASRRTVTLMDYAQMAAGIAVVAIVLGALGGFLT